MEGSKNDIASKNEIRESIQAMFPVREYFTIVRPVNEEHDLQRLDQIGIEKVRPESREGLDALTKFIIEYTKPKQVGSTMMNGPFFTGLIQSFLDALNTGAVPTILTSWQSVEECECRRAYESSIQVYTNAFNKSKPPQEWALREETLEQVLEVLGHLVAEYENLATGPAKAEKLTSFLQKSLEGLIRDLSHRLANQNESEKTDLHLKF